MKKIKYFLFSLVCMFCCSVVFATNEITVDSMIPVYDEISGVIVTEENGEHSVIFNDKDQNVKYNVVIENTTDKDLTIEDISLSKPSQDFLIYELEGLNKNDVLKANSNHEAMVSLSTIKKEGWGRNFNDELFVNVSFTDSVINPNTNDFVVILFILSIVFGCSVFVLKNKKVARYGILIIGFFSVVPYINADKVYMVPIKINVSFESQNVMSKSGKEGIKCGVSDACYIEDDWFYFWKHSEVIKNIYIENVKREIKDYAYEYDVSEEQNGRVKAYLVENTNASDYYDLYLIADGMIYPNSDASYYFAFFNKLETINNLEGLDTSNVTDMNYMFYNTGSDSEIFTLDLSNFDTSNVTDMSFMFYFTGYYSTNLTLDISSFDTSNVTNMESMFASTGYNSTNLTLDLISLDTSNVTNMSGMFARTGSNSTNLTLDLSSFNTSNVTDMSFMFNGTGYSSLNFALDVSNFDTSNVTSMSYMFNQAGYSNPNFTLDVSNFDTSNVIDMSGMFYNTGYSSSIFTLDVSNFDTSNVTNMGYMFNGTGYSSLNFALDVSNFDTSNVTSMSWMFGGTGYNKPTFTLDVSNFDTSKVTNMRSMFENTGYNSENFTLDVSNFDTSKVTNMRNMFKNAGYNSTAFVTTFTIRPKITNSSYYKEMFSGVATKPGSKITVNYTSANSSYINTYINTKSTNSNVVKGVQVD